MRAGDARAAIEQGPIHVTSFFEVTPGGVNQAVGDAEGTIATRPKREPGATQRAGLSGSRRAVPARESIGVARLRRHMRPT